ncbi:hypothetical protein CKO25_15040 [Thiocapsa imhoffii]|uniref:LSDAT prokaryote domain-containing protein n=1 Tax=Thiocapsa imhoffii TaxID=382777 RepID=A0A9X0WK28_9GAMM|nr:hypothetical protein [Thiocapsa imhoffii]MBK1645940.1 hypothetical protein [Thiocapsa imhoffii]
MEQADIADPPPCQRVWIATAQRTPSQELARAFASLDLRSPRPLLVVVGGAGNLPDHLAATLVAIFERITPILDEVGAAVIDGGTAYGVMAAMGQARMRTRAHFPLLGIAPQGAVTPLPTSPAAPVRLDPHHSHILLIPGAHWGDESPWISAAAVQLAAGQPALMLVAAGGDITRLDVWHWLKQRGRVLLLAGTGGMTDQLVAWRQQGAQDAPVDPLLASIDRSLIEVMPWDEAAASLPQFLHARLAPSNRR